MVVVRRNKTVWMRAIACILLVSPQLESRSSLWFVFHRSSCNAWGAGRATSLMDALLLTSLSLSRASESRIMIAMPSLSRVVELEKKMSKKKTKGGCYHCGAADHRAKDCPSAVCQYCGSSGHDVGGCSKKPPPPVDKGQFNKPPTSSDNISSSKLFTFIELFAGMGGFRVALEKLDGQCVWASEMDRFCIENYKLNFQGDRPAGDITQILPVQDWIPDHDLLVGGFPCQPFSSSGRREGLNDAAARGGLFREIVRVLRAKQPKAFLLENVRGLILHDNGKTFDLIRQELEDCGYHLTWKLIDAVHILPQERCRLFIVGIRTTGISVGLVGNNQRYQFPSLPNLRRGVKDILQGMTAEDPIHNLERLLLSPHQISKVQSQSYYKQHPEARFLSDPSKPSKTLQSSYTNYMVGSQFVPAAASSSWRRFSPREAARLQGFPESFQLCTHRPYNMLGNAVAPPLIAMIVAPLLSIIRGGVQVVDGWAIACEMLLEASPPDVRRQELREKLKSVNVSRWSTDGG